MTRTHWLREYLDDFKLESRKDAGTRCDEDNVEPEGRPAMSKGKFGRTFGPRKRLTCSRSRRGAFPSTFTARLDGILDVALAFSETFSFSSTGCFTKKELGCCQQRRGGAGQEAALPGLPAR